MGKDLDLLVDSGYLFARPSFVEGVGRILDVSGSFNVYNTSRDGAEADARGLAHDWAAVGRDLRKALDQLRTAASR